MTLESLGWREHFARQFDDPCLTPARVAVSHRDRFVVWTEAGQTTATPSGRLRRESGLWPTTGDWVLLREGASIEQVLDRQTTISRRNPGGALNEQVLGANVDILFVVAGLDHNFNLRRLERYLILAQEGGVRPVMVLNKADLHSDPSAAVRAVRGLAGGCPILTMSATEGWGVAALHDHVSENETAALAGSSGTGKSTILNSLLGQNRQATQAVREEDSKGRHTTSARELILMPQGWLLMDLPGIRGLQLLADEEAVKNAFEDIAEASENCHFRDCRHEGESGCAVALVVPEDRMAAYQKLRREAAYIERHTDATAAQAEKKRWKAVQKTMNQAARKPQR